MGSSAIGGNAMTGGQSKAPAMTSAERTPDKVVDNSTVAVSVRGDDNSSASGSNSPHVEAASYFGYHVRMLIIAMYMAMLLTDWGVAPESSASGATYSIGYASAWLQMSANWLCSLLYMWTLVAPKLFPNRDFT